MTMTPEERQQRSLNGTIDSRSGPGIKRAIRDIYAPDGACDERMDGLIEQLRAIAWPKPGDPPAQ
jgi:hypothetical protein